MKGEELHKILMSHLLTKGKIKWLHLVTIAISFSITPVLYL